MSDTDKTEYVCINDVRKKSIDKIEKTVDGKKEVG